MEQALIRVGHHIVNLLAVASAHWEGPRLFVYLIGGRFIELRGDEANLIWSALDAQALDLGTGEMKG